MKKTFWIALMLAAVTLLSACSTSSSRHRSADDPAAALGTLTIYTFSDMLYTSDKVFTFYKPTEYDIVTGDGKIVQINGNTHDFRSYFKLYKVKVEEVLYSNDGEPFSEILIKEYSHAADSTGEVEPDDIEVLKENTLYLGFGHANSDGTYTPFDYFEIGRKEKLKDTDITSPWKNLGDIRYTYESELAGGGNIPLSTLMKLQANIIMQYGDELFPSFYFNYKILSDEYVDSEEYAEVSAKKIEKADNNTGQPYFEVLAYPPDSGKTCVIRYDAETGDAIAWTK